MVTARRFAITLLLLALAGCPHSDDPDLVPPTGRWRLMPSIFEEMPEPLADRELLVLGADGSFEVREEFSNIVGSYTLLDGRMQILLENDNVTRDLDYVRFNDRLLLFAMRPLGGGDNLVGRWHGTDVVLFDVERIETTHELEARDDGTSRYVRREGASEEVHDGTFTIGEEWIRITSPFNGFLDFGILEGAVGLRMYELMN